MANKTLSDFPVLTNLDAASVAHVQKELVDYQVTLPVLAPYLAQTAISGADEKTDPVDADMVGLVDSAASNILKKISWANFKAKLNALYPSANGWVTLGLTMTYASADSPTFTATVPGDVTGVLSAGMKLKLTQTTAKYFIITAAPSYASGTGLTTLTLYGGTDYTLDDAAISNVYYSAMKAPFGFPLDPAKWQVLVSIRTGFQDNPTQSVWYNISSNLITVPIGCWYLGYNGCFGATGSGIIQVSATLSTTNNSNSDSDFLNSWDGYNENLMQTNKEKILTLTAKTVYYLNILANTKNLTSLKIWSFGKGFLTARCAYL